MNGYAPFLGQVRLRMGAIVDYSGPPGGLPGAPPITPTPLPLMVRRFEIKDEDGNFISNAAVTITASDGRHFLTKLSDAGGNVAISLEEADAQAKAMGLKVGSLLYTVNAPGKSPASGVFFDKEIPVADQLNVKEITLKPQGAGDSFLVPAVLLTLGAGVIAYAALKLL